MVVVTQPGTVLQLPTYLLPLLESREHEIGGVLLFDKLDDGHEEPRIWEDYPANLLPAECTQ